MNALIALPMEARMGLLFLLGVCLGSAINWAIYGLSLQKRPLSPWMTPDVKAPPRKWFDRLPVVGWLGLRRESGVHGTGFWIRPMLLELLLGVGLAVLYWWEIGQLGLYPPELAGNIGANLQRVLHAQFASHLLLIVLMLAASMIDVDEKVIPDTITLPGTLLGLAVVTAVPWWLGHYCSLLPDFYFLPNGAPALGFMHPTAANLSPEWLAGFPHGASLAIGLGCWWLWCFALLPRLWYTRRGWRKALAYFVAILVRERVTYGILAMGAVGTAVVAGVWYTGGPGWHGLLSGLVGMIGSAGIVWVVRIIGSAALKREAMGFGDVTLMAMIGAFLGWQACLIVFFVAPFAGLAVGILQVILFRDTEIPYGPFLCLASLVAIIAWHPLWDWARPMFAMGWLIPMVVAFCMLVLGVLLGIWQFIRTALR